MQLQHSVAQHCAHIHFTVYMCASWHDMCVLYTQCSMLVCCCIGLSVLRCNFAFPAGAARALAREEQREIQCESALARAERVRQLRDSDVVAKPRWLDRIDKTGVEHAAVGKLHPRAGAAGRADLQGQAGPVLRCVGSRPDSEAAPWTSSPGACPEGEQSRASRTRAASATRGSGAAVIRRPDCTCGVRGLTLKKEAAATLGS